MALQISHSFVLYAEICTTSAQKWCKSLQGYIFRVLQHFATKLCNFTHFKMLFLAMVMDFVLLA